ncbi:MAG TPA: SDR family oxidoreductase [Methyloceanibacter sp.]|jgi:NAD(P)-dependent dehydrogenase (short-subunit alcohol dehydrogenase family)
MSDQAAVATVLVTGAGRRVGRAIAIDLARVGWCVGVHYHRSEQDAAGVVAEIQRQGGKAAALQADLGMPEQLVPLLRACTDELGPVTCLINNAAHYDWDSLAGMSLESWQAHLDVDLRAAVFLTQAFAALLPQGLTGNVINLIDQKVWRLDPGFFSYTIAKSALWTATQTMAQALAPRIRVNAIAPGPVLPSHRQSEAEFERECRETPLGRAATLEEICRTIAFLLATPSITGQMIAVDCGQHLG